MGESNSPFPADRGGGTTAGGGRRGKLQGLAAGRLVAFVSERKEVVEKEIHCLCWAHVGRRRAAQHDYWGFFSFTICFWGVPLNKTKKLPHKQFGSAFNSFVFCSILCICLHGIVLYLCSEPKGQRSPVFTKILEAMDWHTHTHTPVGGYEVNAAGSTHCWSRACPLWLRHRPSIGCWGNLLCQVYLHPPQVATGGQSHSH